MRSEEFRLLLPPIRLKKIWSKAKPKTQNSSTISHNAKQPRPMSRTAFILSCLASILVLVLPYQDFIPVELSKIESLGVVTFAWSVWLLAQNNPLGWWVSIVGVALYIYIFYEAKLYGEIIIQIFFLITGFQGIYLWAKGGDGKEERPVSMISTKILLLSLLTGVIAFFALRVFLVEFNGAAPFWDALTTVIAFVAQVYLINRWLENWYLWIIADIIYIPLYASRELYFTSALYAVLLLMSIHGLLNFRKLYQAQKSL